MQKFCQDISETTRSRKILLIEVKNKHKDRMIHDVPMLKYIINRDPEYIIR